MAEKRILVVDDEADVVTCREGLLEGAGFDVAAAGDGAEAPEAVRRRQRDLLSLDVTMRETFGVRFCRTTREDADLAKTPIVAAPGVENPWAAPDRTDSFRSSRSQVPPPEAFFEKAFGAEAHVANACALRASWRFAAPR